MASLAGIKKKFLWQIFAKKKNLPEKCMLRQTDNGTCF